MLGLESVNFCGFTFACTKVDAKQNPTSKIVRTRNMAILHTCFWAHSSRA